MSAGSSKTITYQYNGVGLVSDMAVSGESSFTYSYNARNQLSSVTKPNSVQVSFTYDNGGRRTRITDPGSYVEYVYNARNWLTDVRNRTTGGTTRYDATYYYQDGSLWDHTGNPVKRVENPSASLRAGLAGSTYTTTLRYDAIYRQTQETKKDSGNNTIYDLAYGYDAVGNRSSKTLGGTTITYTYDDNNKLTVASGGGTSASFSYDNNGNMTSISGTMFGSKTMAYNDENRLTSIAYGGTTDDYYYTYTGLRYRATLNGTTYRYLYDGERVLEELNDSGTMQARYTTENGSYEGMWLHLYRPTGSLSRFPMYDSTGTARGLVDASGTVTDTYELDTFGRSVSSTGRMPNPYRYGGAWGYVTDPSGMLQLGARYYWPELGRFVSSVPVKSGLNFYAYAENSPVADIDPAGTTTYEAPISSFGIQYLTLKWIVDDTGCKTPQLVGDPWLVGIDPSVTGNLGGINLGIGLTNFKIRMDPFTEKCPNCPSKERKCAHMTITFDKVYLLITEHVEQFYTDTCANACCK